MGAPALACLSVSRTVSEIRNRKIAMAAALASMILGGDCAGAKNKEPKPEVNLQEILQMLPGHYDNTAQVQSDMAKGVKPHEAVALDIVEIDALMIGDHVFYVQESIVGDPRRVLGQKLMVLGIVKKDIVQTDFALTDPLRWRNGQLNPDVFKGIMVQDVHSTKGCSLRWKRDEEKFVAANEPKTCHGRVGGGINISQIEAHAELTPLEYATSEAPVEKVGHVADGHAEDTFYRFRKSQGDSE
jgi:hypothetical protein